MIALYRYKDHPEKNGVAYSFDTLFSALFAPISEYDYVILDRIPKESRKTYQDKKELVRLWAMQTADLLTDISVSWGDLVTIQDFFTRYGEKYGLIREFRENGIIC